uniref:N-acetyltransferase domain-containing protein n=1 Tax=Riptortus pedestris TaxID=329032 RepID=R4WR70_RIPPE|nr:conserved hypothetical protein [Riptortus pedestris]
MPPERMELGSFEEVHNGVPLKYRITTTPPELLDVVVDHMLYHFLPREPMCSHFKLHEDPPSRQAIEAVWKEVTSQGLALVAIRDGPEPEEERIVGANITFLSTKGSEKPEVIKGTKFEKVYDAVVVVAERANMYEKYGANEYLSAFGLSVHTDYHGYKIGQHLLECRKPLCKALGIKFTGTVFTHAASMFLSKRVGFEVLLTEYFETFEIDGEVIFKGKTGPFEQSGWDFS